MHALAALVRKDLVLYFSNRRALMITLAAPILIAAFFGAVLGGAPKKPLRVPVAVVDLDQSPVTRSIVAAMKSDSTFELSEIGEAQAVTLVRNGKLRAAIVLPAGFGAAAPRAMFRPGAKPEITVHFDPSQSMTLALVKGLLAQHVMQAVSRSAFGAGASGMKVLADSRAEVAQSRDIADADRRDLIALFDSVERLNSRVSASQAGVTSATGAFEMPFVTRELEVTAGERKYNAYAHSFAGMGVQFVLFMGIEMGVGVLLMRRLGLWKRLRAAPVSRGLLIGSRIASGTLIATLLMAAIYAAAIAFFEVRIDGSIAGFVGVVLAFALLASTFGLLIAAVGRTPEASRGLAILATLLLVMLGGAWVPTFVFPDWLQTATLVVPTRWAIDGLEAMTWRGQGFGAAIAPIGTMLAFSAAFGAIALWRFDWEE
jgi:linearmycin/streptolysin S transport system permease protein